MIVCADRGVAFRLLKDILAIRPAWGEKRRAENENDLTKEQLDKLSPLPKLTLLQHKGLMTKRSCMRLAEQKNTARCWTNSSKTITPISKLQLLLICDYCFDVPSLAVMYIDKPLQKHTLIKQFLA